jgi:hypothetical protein
VAGDPHSWSSHQRRAPREVGRKRKRGRRLPGERDPSSARKPPLGRYDVRAGHIEVNG